MPCAVCLVIGYAVVTQCALDADSRLRSDVMPDSTSLQVRSALARRCLHLPARGRGLRRCGVLPCILVSSLIWIVIPTLSGAPCCCCFFWFLGGVPLRVYWSDADSFIGTCNSMLCPINITSSGPREAAAQLGGERCPTARAGVRVRSARHGRGEACLARMID